MPPKTKRLVFTRPIRRMTQAELDQYLETAANILRGNVDHSEFRGYVFALSKPNSGTPIWRASRKCTTL